MRTPDPEPDEVVVSLPPELLERLDRACLEEGYGTRSAYVAAAVEDAFGEDGFGDGE